MKGITNLMKIAWKRDNINLVTFMDANWVNNY